MAGTGHPYEIANICDVRDFIEKHIDAQTSEPVAEWLRSKKFIKYLTSPEFTARISDTESAFLLDKVEEKDLPFVEKKIADGKDVRVFSQAGFEIIGDDIGHLKDWALSYITENKPSKLFKITVEQGIQASKKWVHGQSLKITNSGTVKKVLDNDNGYFWFQLLDNKALEAEGAAMGHCVGLGGYFSGLNNGTDQFFSLRGEGSRPYITVRISKIANVWNLKEAKGFLNQPVQYCLLDSLIELLRHLNVVEASAHACPYILIKDGEWSRIDQAWEKVVFHGFEAFSHNNTYVVMSRHSPGDMLIKAHGGDGRAWYIQYDQRHYHIEELRDICRISTELKLPIGSNKAIVYDSDIQQYVPYFDRLERREINGVQCFIQKVRQKYIDDEIVYVPHSRDDARILLQLGSDRSQKDGYYQYPRQQFETSLECGLVCNGIRWNITEAKRVQAVLETRKCFDLKYQDSDSNIVREKYDPVRTPDGVWHLFALDHKVTPATHINEAEWKHNDFIAKLSFKHSNIEIYRNKEKLVSGFKAFWLSEKHLQEIASFLNEQKWEIKDFCYGIAQLGEKKEHDQYYGVLYFLRGSWHYVRSLEEAIRLVSTKPKGRRKLTFTPVEAEFVIRFLGRHIGRSDVADVLRVALEVWLKSVKKIDQSYLSMTTGAFNLTDEKGDIGSYEGRLKLCRTLLDPKTPSIQKKMSYLAGLVMKHHLKFKPGYFGKEDVNAFFARYHDLFNDQLFVRGLKFFTGRQGMSSFTGSKGRLMDIRPLYERAERLGYGYKFCASAYWTLHDLPKDPESADLEWWVDCLEIAFYYRGSCYAEATTKLKALLEVSSGHQHLLPRVEAVISNFEARERKREEERLAWQQKAAYPL